MSSKTVGRADLVSSSRTQLPLDSPEVAATASGVFVVKRNRRAARVPRGILNPTSLVGIKRDQIRVTETPWSSPCQAKSTCGHYHAQGTDR